MAQPNEILRPGLNSILTKSLGMKEGAPSPILGPEIMPVMVLETERPEWLFLANEFRVATGVTAIGGIGTQNVVLQIRNPAGSNVLAIIERATMSWAANATTLQAVMFNASLAANLSQGQYGTTANWNPADTRVSPPVGTGSVLQATYSATGAAGEPAGGNVMARLRMSGAGNGWIQNMIPEVLDPFVLTPGTQAHFWMLLPINVDGGFAVQAKVRGLEPSETR